MGGGMKMGNVSTEQVGDKMIVTTDNYVFEETVGRTRLFKRLNPLNSSLIFDSERIMNDITAEFVELKIRNDSKVIWVNTEKGCVLRICQIKNLILDDMRKKR